MQYRAFIEAVIDTIFAVVLVLKKIFVEVRNIKNTWTVLAHNIKISKNRNGWIKFESLYNIQMCALCDT